MAKEKEDGFDKVEKAVKKTTKIAVLVIGSIVTIVLAAYLAWGQISGEIKKEDQNEIKKDTVVVEKIDTVVVEKPKTVKNDRVVVTPKKESVIDKSDDVINKVERLKKIGPILKKD